MNFDILQFGCWSLVYFFIIIYSIKSKETIMPINALVLNLSWEIIALKNDIVTLNTGIVTYIHIVWLLLDLIMLILYLIRKRNVIKVVICIEILIISCLLNYIFEIGNGMLVSCFIIDLLMAIFYVIFFYRKQLPKSLIIIIIILFKLLGDLFAWLFYRNFMNIINYIGIIVLILNVLCFFIYYYKNKTIYSNK